MKTKHLSSERKVLVRGLLLVAAILLWGNSQQANAQWSTNGTNVYYNGGNVGIGTNSPNLSSVGSAVTLNGASDFILEWAVGGVRKGNVYHTGTDMQLFNNANGVLKFGTNNTERMRIDASGNVGIGTTGPSEFFHIRKDQNAQTRILLENQTTGTGANTQIQLKNDTGLISSIGIYSGSTTAYGAVAANDSYIYSTSAGLDLMADNTSGIIKFATGGNAEKMRINAGGNVGIGTTTPTSGYKLDVYGNTNVTGNLNSTGTITGGNIVAKYQDVAEWVPSSQQLPAGTVVVLDSTKSNQVIAATQSYDTRVAGVISEQSGIALGERGANKVLVATTGRVLVKVDATDGPIHIGDLLVTSNAPGLAMKSEPVNLGGVQIHRPGTLIGKALEPMEKGSGKILVLLSLQ